MTFAWRRLLSIPAAVVLSALLGVGLWLYDLSLRDATFASGWLVLGGVVLLALYNVHKKLPFMPLVDSSIWLQVHVYGGLVTAFVFAFHTSFRLPNGVLETLLWLLFVAVVTTGLMGIGLSRLLPNRLRRHGERIIFERIPTFRAKLADEVGALALRSVTETGSNTISQYYAARLLPYFHRPRNLLVHVLGSDEPVIRMMGEIKSLERYLSPQGKEILGEIEARVMAKNNLDYQYALQLVLKAWLFVHVPLSYSLIVVAAVHGVLAYAFIDGSP